MSQVLIAVMGATGSGKTTFINLASGSHLQVGNTLRSCTGAIQFVKPFTLDGREVTLIDTPGFDDTTKSDTEILRMISENLANTYQQGRTLAGVIYMHRISDFRMGGISTRNFKMFRKLCGDDSLKNVVIVTNMWGGVSPAVGDAREAELARDDMFFKPVLDKGAAMMRHINTLSAAQEILRKILNNHPIPLHIQRELVDEKKDFSRTAAAQDLHREIEEQRRRQQEEVERARRQMEAAMAAKEEEARRERERAAKALADRIQAEQEANRRQQEAEMLQRQLMIAQQQEQMRIEAEQAAQAAMIRQLHIAALEQEALAASRKRKRSRFSKIFR